MKPAFLITIDVEGDNLWAAPARPRTENARWLPRFQALCQQYGLKPTYLATYEMARCPDFAALGRQVIESATGEVGAHLHAWNSPPLEPVTSDDTRFGPYATEYPAAALAAKVATLTAVLENTFGVKMTSHRAGRWGFDAVYARILVEHGYRVDCSVTPGVSWRSSPGSPDGEGGPDYRQFPREPYFLDPDDIARPGASPLLEVPVTILPASPRPIDVLRRRFAPRALPRRALNRLFPPLSWLRPGGGRGARREMLRVLKRALDLRLGHVEFMLHSSELMPGGSPVFPDEAAVERLYAGVDALFAAARGRFTACTLSEFAAAPERFGVRPLTAARGAGA